MFCVRECTFNTEVTDRLEAMGYEVHLPQRDGFEFSDFLNRLLEESFPTEHERKRALSWIIYLIDVGEFLNSSDICIANLDETLDPGVLIEMMFAKHMQKPVIGYRTDMRTPFGSVGDIY